MQLTGVRGGGVSGGKTKIRDNMRMVLAWLSFFAACVCGAALASTFLGGWISGFAGLWRWVGLAMLVVAAAVVLADILADFEPNRRAVYTVMVTPSLAAGVGGRFSDTVGGTFGQLFRQVGPGLSNWLGEGSAWGIAIATGLAAAIFARRHVKTHVG
jgi:hypothetical protein